ncbi:MAG: A/G-specific adenine glycosylase [Deltaproteobacteria bacterium]|nr:A/G-specific adenine glycosylase [Deltaproteobacteria bacterium]
MNRFRGGKNLLQWYRAHRRDLPWRRTKDPYKIWVSEIMLQQTTVETVIPYYQKFLKRFPTVEVLAKSEEEEVLRYWSGLGYYSRARNLHRATQLLVASEERLSKLFATHVARRYAGSRVPSRPSCHHKHGDDGLREVASVSQTSPPRLPANVDALMKLPGIGRYTAGAIASIAFGEKVPVVDGNVIRVLSRLFSIRSDPKSAVGQKIFWSRAALILPDHDVGDFNQALMELGATLCTPKQPACLVCPLFSECDARKDGKQDLYPRMAERPASRKVIMTAAVVRKKDRLLMVQRPKKGILRGMWEFPMVEGDLPELQRSFSLRPLKRLPPVRHSILNRRLRITPYICRLQGRLPRGKFRWIGPDQIRALPTSSMNQKILSQLIG